MSEGGVLAGLGALRDRRDTGNLLALAAAGDREAFDRLLAPQLTHLRRFVSRSVSPSDVEDVLQEVRLAAWQSLHRFEGRSALRTWLVGIALRKCREHLTGRASQIARHTVQGELADSIGTDRDMAAAESRDRVRRILSSLSEEHSEILVLYYIGGLTLKEIAEALDVNLNTIKYRFYRAHEEASKEGA